MVDVKDCGVDSDSDMTGNIIDKKTLFHILFQISLGYSYNEVLQTSFFFHLHDM